MTAPDPMPPADAPPPPAAPGDRGVSPIAGRFGGRQGKLITLAALAVVAIIWHLARGRG